MQTTKQPYELLVRWDLAGQLSGAQIQHRYVITGDDGAVLGASDASVEPLTMETAAGFPLGDLLTEVQADALIAHGTVLTERDRALADLSEATQRLIQAQAERDAALLRTADLEAQIAALRSDGAP